MAFSYEKINEEWSEYCLKNLLEIGLSWKLISLNPNITFNLIKKYGKFEYVSLSANPNITWDIVQQHPDELWNYSLMSKNPNITWDIVQNNSDKPWNYRIMCSNPNITWDIIKSNTDKFNDYYMLSKNPNITWDIVQENSDKYWDYDELIKNTNITSTLNNIYFDELLLTYERSKNKTRIKSINSNITFEIIKKSPNILWDYNNLAKNNFTLEKEMFFIKKLQEWFKKSDLKRELIANLWHPKNYKKFKYYDPEMFSDDDEEEEE